MAMMLITLIIGLMAGPAVSLFGSPTVSPVTDALCAAARHLNGEEQAGHDRSQEHSAEGPRAEDEADRQRRDYRDDARQDHLALSGGGNDPHSGAVLGLSGALHDSLDLAELAPDL